MIIALIFAAIILLQQERLRDLERKNKKIRKQLKVEDILHIGPLKSLSKFCLSNSIFVGKPNFHE